MSIVHLQNVEILNANAAFEGQYHAELSSEFILRVRMGVLTFPALSSYTSLSLVHRLPLRPERLNTPNPHTCASAST